MSDKSKTALLQSDPFAPFDFNERSKEIERTDVFNRLTDDAIPVLGGLRTKLEELANTDNAEVIAALAEHGVMSPRVPQPFHLSNGQKATVWADDSGWHSAAIFDGQQVNFTADSRDGAMMLSEKYLQQNHAPHFNELTEGQRLNIARLAQNGDWQSALGTYLYFVLGDEVTDMHPEEIASNPKFVPVMNQAVYFVFRHVTNGYVPTPEAEVSLAKFAGDRPLTMSLCSAWWLTYLDDIGQRRAAQADAPENERQPAPTPEEIQQGLESLSDEQLNKLHLQTLQHRGHAIRRFDERMRGQ
jgi:hypothetical protein